MNAPDGYAAQIKAMAADGLSDARIAEALPTDTDDQKVYRWRKKHGVEKVVRHVSRLDPYAADIRRMYVEEGLTDERITEQKSLALHKIQSASGCAQRVAT